jgi:hypothetical protein
VLTPKEKLMRIVKSFFLWLAYLGRNMHGMETLKKNNPGTTRENPGNTPGTSGNTPGTKN